MGALSYGTTNANMNFKMPGWGSNTGIDRSQSIWYVNQSSATVITPLEPVHTKESTIMANRIKPAKTISSLS